MADLAGLPVPLDGPTLLNFERLYEGIYSDGKKRRWFQYARVVRNVLSHKDGAVLHKWPPDLTRQGISSVSWRGRVIAATEVGKHVSLDAFEMKKLHDDMAEFLRFDLS